jgi:hypothetical protein
MRSCCILLLMSILTLFSCTSNEVGDSKDVNPDAIYFDYKIRSEEKDSVATVYLQYRMGGPNGTTLVLTNPAKVELDGEIIPVDSSRFGGAFYEVQKPVDSFAGPHEIVFTDINNKQYKEQFSFQPLILKTSIPPKVQRGGLAFDFGGLASVDYLRVFATDTSFGSNDISEIDTVRNGRVVVSPEKLKNLVNGPITIQFSKELDRRIKDRTREGGRIVVSSGLQREFLLEDTPKP